MNRDIGSFDTSERETSQSVAVEDHTLIVHPPEDRYVELPCDVEMTTTIATGVSSTVTADFEPPSRMRYQEDAFLEEALDHIKSTYGQHYANPDKEGFQLVDLWDSQGSLATTARDLAMKYLTRYGKKDGYNQKDLFKAIHYITMINYANRDR